MGLTQNVTFRKRTHMHTLTVDDKAIKRHETKHNRLVKRIAVFS